MKNVRTIRSLAALVCTALAVAVVLTPHMSAADSADAIIDKMVAAHGGIEKWSGAPSVFFADDWSFGGMTLASNVHVEQGDRRSLSEYPAFDATIGWDGEKAWSKNWAMPSPPRFMAQLNYYFVCLPWLVKDPAWSWGRRRRRPSGTTRPSTSRYA